MSNLQIESGQSVTVTIVDTDDVTGAVVPPTTVTPVLSNTGDTFILDASLSFLTLTAGPPSINNTLTVNATVNGVSSTPGVVTYDVLASADATTVTLNWGTPFAAEVVSLNALSEPVSDLVSEPVAAGESSLLNDSSSPAAPPSGTLTSTPTPLEEAPPSILPDGRPAPQPE